MSATSIYDFVMDDIDGQTTRLDLYKGQVIFIVNVASKCGFTAQYAALQGLYERYKDRGFVVLGFPANNFLWQEPGSNIDIKSFCTSKYGVTFPMFAKISVRGSSQCALYNFLTDKSTNPDYGGKIKWNFTKFLIDRNGSIVDRFAPTTKPDSKKVTARIDDLIA